MKKCVKCGMEKGLDQFPKTGRICKACRAEYLRILRQSPEMKLKMVEYRQQNRDRINEIKRQAYRRNAATVKSKNNRYYHDNADRCRARQRDYQIKTETKDVTSWLAKCLKHAKSGDIRLNRDFNITLDYIYNLYNAQGGRCAITGQQMTHNRDDLFAISIDRIDSSIGHIIGNVQLVCRAINLAKRELTNDDIYEFMLATTGTMSRINVPDFSEYDYPESTAHYPLGWKRAVIEKLRRKFDSFIPPQYDVGVLNNDLVEIGRYSVNDYLIGNQWRLYKPENKPWAGKRMIWHFQPHLWSVKTQDKPTIPEVWGQGPIFERALTNLVNGETKISFDRIIRELIFAGAGVPSQMHPGFAKAVLMHFGARGILYDPCCGWGGRLLAAHNLGLSYHGCELSPDTHSGLINIAKTCGMASYNIRNVDCLSDDVPKADIMFTSPPFGSESYKDSMDNIDIHELLRRTSNIPLRILHVNTALLRTIEPSQIIPIQTRNRAADVNTDDYLAIFRTK